jgi:DNA-directed RNA polymerase beta subunit
MKDHEILVEFGLEVLIGLSEPTRTMVKDLLSMLDFDFNYSDLVHISESKYSDTDELKYFEILKRVGAENMMQEMVFPEGQKVNVFFAPVAWSMIKHNAEDKIKKAPANPFKVNGGITRQPASGRMGALRVGKQECAAFIAGNSTAILTERSSALSDSVKILICNKCGRRADVVYLDTNLTCTSCGEGTLYAIKTSYAIINFIQTLNSLGIDIMMFPEETN